MKGADKMPATMPQISEMLENIAEIIDNILKSTPSRDLCAKDMITEITKEGV